jgi:hypothetical protein
MTDRDDDMLEQNLTTLLAGSEPTGPDPSARARMRQRLVARHGRVARERSRVALVGWGLIAAAASAVVVAQVAGDDAAPTPPAAIAPPPVDDGLIRLADGSTARLGPGGKLTAKGARRVVVEGEVLLDIAPGQGTFTVETAQGELAVLGTRFVVAAAVDRTTAAVLRGVVALRSGGHEELIRAGEQGEMRQGQRPTRGPAPRLSHLVSWVAERRAQTERPASGPARSGALVARDPAWQEQEFPLPMTALTVDVHLENQQARVALDQTFHNPQDRTLEGVYKFALPPGAAVSRLAMYVDGRLMESAVVERMAARRIYEDIVYQRRDPALLEQMGASKVSMRIFPLFPRQDKRVVLAYTQPLARTYDDLTLTVPLPDLDQPVGALAMQVKVLGCAGCEITSPSHAVAVEAVGQDALVRYAATDERLGDSLVLRVRQGGPAVTLASTIDDAKRYALIRVRPSLPAAPAAAGPTRPNRWVILDDTSASRGPSELAAQAAMIDRLIDDIDERDQVMVVAFDATHRRFNTWQDAMAIDRRALAAFLAKDAGLGETDLREALAGAVSLLDGQPGYVVYLGDGTATGERRTIDELRDAIAGRATFIGLGVGDGADLTTLGALADATGGIATTIDLGDDLAWRSLDLVASLYTPRVTGLTATIDGVGAEASTLLRARQVAAGEDIEVVVRAPARDDLRTLTLRGRLDGQPWSQTIDLAGVARAPGDGGYLPRLWAQRRLEALATAGDRALAPCTSAPCPTDEERAIAAYHARKAEMVALGTEHFLLSPHTSLIVLENDAMYAQYGVRKGTGAGWATYALPATVPVGARPPAVAAAAAAPLWRAPLAWRWGGEPYRDEEDFGGLGGDELGVLGAIGTGSAAGTGTGTGYGTLGFASRGYGRGAGGGGRASAAADVVGKKGDASRDRADADLDAARGELRREAEPATASEAADKPDPAPLADDLAAAPAAAAPAAMPTAPMGSSRGAPAKAKEAESKVASNTASSAAWAEPARRSRGPAPDVVGRLQAATGSDRLTWELQQPVMRGQDRLVPVALQYSADWRLSDLTIWLPGLARTPFDAAADALEAGLAGRVGSITPEATAMLTAARARLGAGRWRWGDEAEVLVDDRGRFAQRRTLDSGVTELVTYDGATLAHRYPEFGIGADRAVGDREPALDATVLPLVPPRPSYLARFYRVERQDDRRLALAPVAGGPRRILTLADDGTVATVVDGEGGAARTVLAAVADATGWRVTAGGRTTRVTFQPDRNVRVPDITPAAVTLTLPLAQPAVATAAVAAAVAGGPAWRTAQHHRAAAALAVGDLGAVAVVLRELAAVAPLSSGELTLVSAAARLVDAATLARAVGAQASPIVDHLRASRDGDARALAAAATDPGAIGALAVFRQLLQAGERGDVRATRAAVAALAARGPNPVLRAVAIHVVGRRFAWSEPSLIDELDALATGPDRNLLRAELAHLAANGRRGGGGERWAALMADVDLAAPPPSIGAAERNQIVFGPRGALGWTQGLAAWRARVLASDRLDHVLAFARAAALDPGDDLDAALERAVTLASDDVDALLEVAGLAERSGRVAKARSIIDGALAARPAHPALLRLAAATAARDGQLTAAADLLDRAMTAEADLPVALSKLRADYGTLIDWRAAVARDTAGAARDAAIEAVLEVGRDWRAMDPDHAARDEQLGRFLVSVGRTDDAWRYLSSPIDRAPREGASFERAASALEDSGQLAPAVELWRRAFAIDATNPTWLQRQAMAELALGRTDAARATVQKILDRRWHVRWDGVRYWAESAARGM